MSQYTDFSDNVFACLQESTRLWPPPDYEPEKVSGDTVVRFFVASLKNLRD